VEAVIFAPQITEIRLALELQPQRQGTCSVRVQIDRPHSRFYFSTRRAAGDLCLSRFPRLIADQRDQNRDVNLSLFGN
jgi:hypothetical protein